MCGSQDHTASLWDLQNEVLMVTYRWHKDEVRYGKTLNISITV